MSFYAVAAPSPEPSACVRIAWISRQMRGSGSLRADARDAGDVEDSAGPPDRYLERS